MSNYRVLRIETRERLASGATRIRGVDLASSRSGLAVKRWDPVVSGAKDGGVYADSRLAHGRRLMMRRRANVSEPMEFVVSNYSPDALIRDTQELRRLLEKAAAYDAGWHDEPVWIKAQGVNETNPRYSVIVNYETPRDGFPYGGAFWTAVELASFPDFPMIVERRPEWLADEPGTGACVEASGMQEDWVISTWSLNTAQPASRVYDIIELSSGFMLAAANAQVWRTNTGGAVWTAAAAPPVGQVYAFCEHLGFAYCICDGGIYRSADNGDNWALINAGITPGAPGFYSASLLDGGGGYLYASGSAAGIGLGVFRSNNGGVGFVPLSVTCYGRLFETSSGAVLATNGSDASRSADGFIPWAIVSDADVISVIELPGGTLVGAGASGKVYRSIDDGISWGLFSMAGAGQNTDLTFDSLGNIVMVADAAGTAYVHHGDSIGSGWRTLALPAYQGLYSVQLFSGNDRLYAGEGTGAAGDIVYSPTASIDLGRTATCADEVFVANKDNRAQLTHVYAYRQAGGVYTSQLPAAAFPFDLLPGPAFAIGDMAYFGIDSSVMDAGPFCSLAFDIETPLGITGAPDIRWEYSQGGGVWPTLTVVDGTRVNWPLDLAGVNSVHWVPPSDWAVDSPPGLAPAVSALWVRVRVVAGVWQQNPTQGNRDVYTVNWAHAGVDDGQVGGDVEAAACIKLRNRSDKDGYATVGGLDLFANRVLAGLRMAGRGESFQLFINLADEQNPIGVVVAAGAASTVFGNDIQAPTGRRMVHTTDGASVWRDQAVITFGPGMARQWFGRFHAFLRAQQVNRSAAQGEVLVRLQARTGSGGIAFTTDPAPFPNLNPWQLLDFKALSLPVAAKVRADELPDVCEVAVQVWSSAAALTVYLWGLALLPTDECALDLYDSALERDSGVTVGRALHVDSVFFPKFGVRALVRSADAGQLIYSGYVEVAPGGEAVFQANADQRCHFLMARACVTGTHTGANNQTTLTDANASFLTSSVIPGQVILNVTDGSVGVTGMTIAATTISNCLLAGGAENDWDTNDAYLIVAPCWRSEPWLVHSVQLWHNARYLSMRGGR